MKVGHLGKTWRKLLFQVLLCIITAVAARPSPDHAPSYDTYSAPPPPPTYHSPAPTYANTPAPTYTTPAPAYTTTAPTYHAPAPTYAAPTYNPAYHAPAKPVYHAPVVKAAPTYHAPAQVYHTSPTYHAPAKPTYHAEPTYPDEISPYTYNYAVADDYSKAVFSAGETSDGASNVEGSYSVNLPDGRVQHVKYHSNGYDGFVADVTYEGEAHYPTAPKYHTLAPKYHAPAPAYHAPAPRYVSAPAPSSYKG